MKTFKTLLATAALFGAGTGAALAQSTDTTTFNVTITITDSCEFTTTVADDIEFGDVVRSTTPTDVTGNLYVNCSLGTPYTIGLDGGSNYGGVRGEGSNTPAAGSRNMANVDVAVASFVPYDLFQPGGTAFWGNESGTWYEGTGTGEEDEIEVTGRINAAGATNVPAGDYIDTVTATLTF